MSIVTCEFLGRTANLMFQTSACIGYAKTHGFDWFIPPHYHHKQIYKFWPKLPVYRGNIRKLWTYDVATDEKWGYMQMPSFGRDLRLRGFFQSEKFFKHAEAEVREAFPLHITPVDYVSIHVRRGDYLDKDQSTFAPVDMRYLTPAIDVFKQYGKTRFMVFSDDIPWCQQNLKDADCEFKFITGQNEFKDLSLMASCTDHIIANSSFSWWGSWLGHNKDKVVVSPHNEAPNWFAHNRMDTTHLLPEEWVKIKWKQ